MVVDLLQTPSPHRGSPVELCTCHAAIAGAVVLNPTASGAVSNMAGWPDGCILGWFLGLMEVLLDCAECIIICIDDWSVDGLSGR